LDPDRDEDNTKFDGAKNLQALLDHLSHVWESIYASIDTAPRYVWQKGRKLEINN
jgi:hypothetical protein